MTGSNNGWTQVWMDTLVSIRIAGADADVTTQWAPTVDRAYAWFGAVQNACSRFDPDGAIATLARRSGQALSVSPILTTALRISLDMAALTDGAFDPAVGGCLAAAGFDRDYRTGRHFGADLPLDPTATWRDIHLDAAASTVTMARPLLLDLGAVAKGLAVDLAARELAQAPGAIVDAGGDAYLHGHDQDGRPWRAGLADPRRRGGLLGALALSNRAIATSGTYARDHIIRTRAGIGGTPVVQATVLAPTTVLADTLSCGALVLGIPDGLDLLSSMDGVDALLIGEDGSTAATPHFPSLAAA